MSKTTDPLEIKLIKRFHQALADYQLLEDGDHILVALSGGKDSLLLTELMSRQMRIHKPQIKVSIAHVRMENVAYESDSSYLEGFCSRLGVPLYIMTTRFDRPSVKQTTRQKPPCFLCSWNRRKQLFNLAQELGCNKIALGHHQDDILKTTLMNLTFEGSFSGMPVRLKMQKMPLTIIRPLALCQEDDIRAYARCHQYLEQKKKCPYEHETTRHEVNILYNQMQGLNPEARYSLWHALEKSGKLIG